MPKKVMDGLLRRLRRDIAVQHHAGDRFPPLRELAGRYEVSYRVAHKAVRTLCNEGMLEARPNRGITVRSTRNPRDVSGKKIAFISGHDYRHLYDGFFAGVKATAEAEGVAASLIVNDRTDVTSTAYGGYLLNLNVDGVLTLLLTQSALPFCYAVDRGLDIVSDYPYAEFPQLPAVFGDDFRHGREAMRKALDAGAGDILVVSMWPDVDRPATPFFKTRFAGVQDALKGRDDVRVARIDVSGAGSLSILTAFFNRFSRKSSVVTIDYDSIPFVASWFYRSGIKVTDANFIVYDAPERSLHYYGLPQLHTVAPSFSEWGAAMTRKLIAKWKTGVFAEPIWEKI